MLRGHGSKTLALALLSACGGATPSVDSNAAIDDGSARDAADAEVSLEWDATARSDAAEDAGLDATDAPAHDASITDAEGDARALDTGLDANPSRDADPSPDGSAPADGGVDAGSVDASPAKCGYGFEPDYAFCKAAGVLEVNVPLTMQDTVNGARGDCAEHASGPGGRNLYYRFMAPAGMDSLLVATTKQLNRTPLIRTLSDCYATKAEGGARGFSDKATTCVRNRQGAAREVVVAVALYSGLDSESMTFELVATPVASSQSCP